MVSKPRIAGNMASMVGARLLDIGVILWLQQYLVRRIQPAEYAVYPVIVAVMAFAPLVTMIMTSGISREITRALVTNQISRAQQVVSTMFPILLVTAFLVGGLGILLSYHVDKFLDIDQRFVQDARLIMAVLVVSFAAQLAGSPFGLGPYVRQRFVLHNAIELLGHTVRVFCLFVLLFGVGTRVLWVAVAHALGVTSSLLLRIVVSKRILPELTVRRSDFRWGLLHGLINFGFWNFVRQMAGALRNSMDPILLNRLATPVDVTCFYLGGLFYRQTVQAWRLVSTPLAPVLIGLHAQKRERELQSAFLRAGRYALWISLGMAAPLAVYRNEFFLLYAGPEYVLSASVLFLLVCTLPLEMSVALLGRTAHATGAVRAHGCRVIIMESLNLLLTIYTVGVLGWGAIGSATGTLVSRIVCVPALIWPFALRLLKIDHRRWLIETVLPGTLPTLGATAVWVCFQRLLSPATWLSLTISFATGATVYLVLILTCCLRRADRKDLNTTWRRVMQALP